MKGNLLLYQMLRDIIAEWLEQGMRQGGWSQTSLAQRSGIARATIWNVLNKAVDPAEATLAQLAKTMKWPLPELVARLPVSPAKPSAIKPPDATISPRKGSEARVAPQNVVSLVGSAITAAVLRAIDGDELEHTDKGRCLLGELLTDLGVMLEKNGIRATELLDVAMNLRKGKRNR